MSQLLEEGAEISLRFPDLPKEALCNETGSRLFYGGAPQEPGDWLPSPWASLSRLGTSEDELREEDIKGRNGLKNVPEWKPIHLAECRPWTWLAFLTGCVICCPTRKFYLRRVTWLWNFNLLCAIAHSVLFAFSLAPGLDEVIAPGNTSRFDITIYRQKILWQPGYQFSVSLEDNGMPLRIDYLCAGFFGLSAVFHLLAVVVGLFDCSYWMYWRQLDLAFAPWRWIEYAASGSLMAVAIAVLTGTRNEDTLACIFILHVCTMLMGFFTELYSRPEKLQSDPVVYDFSRWEGDPDPSVIKDNLEGRFYKSSVRNANYRRRMIPHAAGFIPYLTAWTIIVENFLTQLDDLRQGDEDLFARVPSWIPLAVLLIFIIFSTFTFVQIWYQYQPPRHYWKTEIWYCTLSATAKVVLGLLLYVNVLVVDARFDETVSIALSNSTA